MTLKKRRGQASNLMSARKVGVSVRRQLGEKKYNLSITDKLKRMMTLLPNTWHKTPEKIEPNSIVAIGTYIYKRRLTYLRFRDVLKLYCLTYGGKDNCFYVYCKSVPWFTCLRYYQNGLTTLYKSIFDLKITTRGKSSGKSSGQSQRRMFANFLSKKKV